MFNELKKMLSRTAVAGGLCLSVASMALAGVETAKFQNGAFGYQGTTDRFLSDRENGAYDADGDTVASYYLDGFATGDQFGDTQYLVCFEDIIGDANNQIPADATILDAELTVTTSLAGNAHTGGPFGVSALLQEFGSSTTYFGDFSSAENAPECGSRGAWWQDGSATRPAGGYGRQMQGYQDSATVTRLVQSWVDGTVENYGMVVQAGMNNNLSSGANTTDGWSIRSTGYPIADQRPELKVTYTTQDVEINSFQEGVNDYAGTTMIFINSGSNALVADDGEEVNDVSTEEYFWFDGIQFSDIEGNTSSPDLMSLIKFDGIFDQVPSDVPVAKAWIVLTTTTESTAAQSGGPYSAYTMLTEWDMTSMHSSFGETNGLQVGEGEISLLDTQDGMIQGAEVWFDVTDYVEGVRTGATDYGIAIQGNGTADGWQVFTPGCSDLTVRPRLVVYSADLDS